VFPCDWHNKDFTLLFQGSPSGFWNFSASGTTSLFDDGSGILALDCFQIVGHFVITMYVLLIYFAKQIYYKLYELK
jgi:hypothetical protein